VEEPCGHAAGLIQISQLDEGLRQLLHVLGNPSRQAVPLTNDLL
jgi:hypothetical protein